VAYLGDCEQNTAAGVEMACAKLGVDFIAICPPEFEPRPEVQESLRNNASLKIIDNPVEGVKDVDVIYTDIWVNPGFEDQSAFRYEILRPYQLNETLLENARKDVLVMHNLPARRGEEITDGVMRSANCIVFDQAENRLHTQKAILHWAMNLDSQ
jgi:ornithine carbamoyltransferase